jgi:hypothetical protein
MRSLNEHVMNCAVPSIRDEECLGYLSTGNFLGSALFNGVGYLEGVENSI